MKAFQQPVLGILLWSSNQLLPFSFIRSERIGKNVLIQIQVTLGKTATPISYYSINLFTNNKPLASQALYSDAERIDLALQVEYACMIKSHHHSSSNSHIVDYPFQSVSNELKCLDSKSIPPFSSFACSKQDLLLCHFCLKDN